LKKEGIQLFKFLSKIEFEIGLISLQDYYLRLVTLYQLTNKSETLKSYISDLFGEVDFSESEYVDVKGFDIPENQPKRQNKESINYQGDEDNPTLKFTTPKTGKISKWKFTKGDADFFPSIPHGHATINQKIKLDCYQGYYFNVINSNNKAMSIGRETRQYIIDLWNNDKFRAFAIDQIDWYLMQYPGFTWRVPVNRIRKIPRKR
jgi:hypothetical protein